MNGRSEALMACCFAISMCSFRISTALGNIFWVLGIFFSVYVFFYSRPGNLIEEQVSITNVKRTYQLYIMMLVFMVPSVIFSLYYQDSLKTFAEMWLYRTIPFLSIPFCIKKKALLDKMFLSFIFIEAVEASLAVSQIFHSPYGRGGGFNETVMELAGMLAIIIPPVIVGCIDSKVNFYIKRGCCITLPFLLLGAIAGQSRGLWLTILVVSPILLYKYIIKNKKIFIISGLCMVTIIGGFLMTPQLVNRVDSITNMTTDRSNADRLILWESSINMIKDYPITGVGPGNWNHEYEEKYELKEITQKNLNHSHNNIIQLTSETGIIGGVGFLVFTFYMVISNFLLWRRTGNPYALMQFAIWWGFTSFGIIDSTISGSANAKTLWYMSGLMIAMQVNWQQEKNS